MSGRIQISKNLYDAMVRYIQHHFDPACREEYLRISAGIKLKESNIRRRNLYGAYKAEKDPYTVEVLRQAYLDESGIPSHGRWDAETDTVLRNNLME